MDTEWLMSTTEYSKVSILCCLTIKYLDIVKAGTIYRVEESMNLLVLQLYLLTFFLILYPKPKSLSISKSIFLTSL